MSQFLVIEEASNAVNAQIINQLNSLRKDPSENRKSHQKSLGDAWKKEGGYQ